MASIKTIIKIPSLTPGRTCAWNGGENSCMMTNLKIVLFTEMSRALPNVPYAFIFNLIFDILRDPSYVRKIQWINKLQCYYTVKKVYSHKLTLKLLREFPDTIVRESILALSQSI